MNPVKREEIIDYRTYEEQRAEVRRQMMDIKEARRVHVGKYLTFLFETHDTVRYQILEMMRAEQIVKEADIRHGRRRSDCSRVRSTWAGGGGRAHRHPAPSPCPGPRDLKLLRTAFRDHVLCATPRLEHRR